MVAPADLQQHTGCRQGMFKLLPFEIENSFAQDFIETEILSYTELYGWLDVFLNFEKLLGLQAPILFIFIFQCAKFTIFLTNVRSFSYARNAVDWLDSVSKLSLM